MSKDTSFHDYIIHDVLHDIPDITSKNMFGGWGIYKQGKIFAIIVDGELYFKVNGKNKTDFENLNSHPFTYERNGKQVSMSYWLVPEEILEDKNSIKELIDKSA